MSGRPGALLVAAGALLAGACRDELVGKPAALAVDVGGVDWGAMVERLAGTANLISNGGFEANLAPWFVPQDDAWRPGEVVTSVARGGRSSLATPLRAATGTTGQRRWGAMYEVGTVPFPRVASLWYRVERWEAANAPQYLLFAVLLGAGGQTYQMRYFLAGVETIPYNDQGNARFVLARKGPPETGRWISFTADLHRDFRERWGRVPQSFEWLRFAVETRYEVLGPPLERAIAADVYFDDVTVGWSAPAPSPPGLGATTPPDEARP